MGADEDVSGGGYTPLKTVDAMYDSSGGESSPVLGGGKVPATIRVLKYIQHDDAGPIIPVSEASVLEPEMIEVPPAYADLRRSNALRGNL